MVATRKSDFAVHFVRARVVCLKGEFFHHGCTVVVVE